MNWFYALNGQQAGPVDDAELDRLVAAGTIEQSTLVWHSGLPQWQPYADARRTAPAAGSPAIAAPGEGQAQCSQCGQVFPADEIVRVEGYDVCAACKPMLLQKLREGVAPAGPYGYASAAVYGGFWLRFGAAVLDGLILIPVYVLYGLALYFLTSLHNVNFNDPQAVSQLGMMRVYLPFNLALVALLACYSAFCVSQFGGTPGKRICKLRVAYGDVGGKVSFGRALGRYAAKSAPNFVPVLGLIYRVVDALFIVFDARKRSLHDMMADTRVVVDR